MKKFTKSLALSLMLLLVATNYMSAQQILYVDRDGSFQSPDIYTDDWQFIQPALDEMWYEYEYYEVEDLALDGPDEAYMSDYPIVFWFTGEAWQNSETMTQNDEFNLLLYLQLDNGTLLLSSQDYLYDRYGSYGIFSSGEFPYDILGLNEVVQDVWNIELPNPDTANILGVEGSCTEGMAFTVFDIYTEEVTDDGLYIDDFILHQGDDLLEIIFPDPNGIGAYQYDAGNYKLIFTTVSIAAIVDLDDRIDILNRSIAWLLGTTNTNAIKMEQTDMVVYPNPATTSVQIGCKHTMEEMWITNSTGQEVDHFNIDNNKFKINTAAYNPGIYFVKVKTENGFTLDRLIVE
nr:T9SS type A sorting domain-containing protein [Bacteroidota bacterium]